ncbi:MAG: DUF4105 domain-containing protein [Magnetococcales bacterium]|nr:DUF4105 domain-containing protein [Magnetococcales bacterium]
MSLLLVTTTWSRIATGEPVTVKPKSLLQKKGLSTGSSHPGCKSGQKSDHTTPNCREDQTRRPTPLDPNPTGLSLKISQSLDLSYLISQSLDLPYLAQSQVWQKLLQYEKSPLPFSTAQSAITSESFFLSPAGSDDALLEMKATLHALFAPQGEDANAHARCRFPARTMWLRQKIPALSALPKMECPDYDQWTDQGLTQSISIIFPNGYLGNPASYYGHILLKFNSKEQNIQTKLSDVSVNYGAIVPDQENPLRYILKGVFGGYDGGFTHAEFYFHNHNYGENELRDMWEYKLNLRPDQVALIVAHTWEVLKKKYRYFFFRENCAYRMAELIALISGVEATPDNPLFTLPIALIQKLNQSQRAGESLIEEVIYHPSRQTRLYRRFQQLSPQKQKVVQQQVERFTRGESAHLPEEYEVLDTLLDYYRFLGKSDESQKEKADEAYRKILAQRYILPPHPATRVIQEQKGPHKARKPSLISVGPLYSTALGSGVRVRIRPAYYDQLDADSSHIKNSSLSMFDLDMALYNDSLFIHNLDIIKIESANTTVTGLEGDTTEAWMILAGLKQQSLSCTECLRPHIQLGKGLVFSHRSDLNITALVGGNLKWPMPDKSALVGQGTIKALYQASEEIGVQLQTQYEIYLFNDQNRQRIDSAEIRYKLSKNSDLRLKYQRDESAQEWSLSTGSYW